MESYTSVGGVVTSYRALVGGCWTPSYPDLQQAKKARDDWEEEKEAEKKKEKKKEAEKKKEKEEAEKKEAEKEWEEFCLEWKKNNP